MSEHQNPAPLTLPEYAKTHYIYVEHLGMRRKMVCVEDYDALRAVATQAIELVVDLRTRKEAILIRAERIRKALVAAEALVAALKEDAERYRQGKHMGVISAAQERLIDAARSGKEGT